MVTVEIGGGAVCKITTCDTAQESQKEAAEKTHRGVEIVNVKHLVTRSGTALVCVGVRVGEEGCYVELVSTSLSCLMFMVSDIERSL